MSLTADDARSVAQLRLKMVENMQANLPAEHGIDKEVLRNALDKVRKDRSLGDATGSKSKAKAPTIPIDLKEFMKK